MTMTNNIPLEPRSALYFGQYRYAINWQQTEVNCIRGLDRDGMMQTMKCRMHYESRRHTSWQNRSSETYTSKFTTQCRSNLESMRAMLASHTKPMKLVLFTNEAIVYTNDIALYDSIKSCFWASAVTIKQADVVLPAESVALKNPLYQYRTYLKNYELESHQKTLLNQWLQNQGSEVSASKSLREFIVAGKTVNRPWHHNHVFSHYFVDHNSHYHETMLNMLLPGIVRKTLRIVQKP